MTGKRAFSGKETNLHEIRNRANAPDVSCRRERLQLYSLRSHEVWVVGVLLQLITRLNVAGHAEVCYLDVVLVG